MLSAAIPTYEPDDEFKDESDMPVSKEVESLMELGDFLKLPKKFQ